VTTAVFMKRWTVLNAVQIWFIYSQVFEFV
jgi:hypothetical protein